MDNPIISTLLSALTPLLTAIVAGLSVVVGIIMSKWATREKTKAALIEAQEKLKIMKINGETAVQAVEQMYWDKSNDEKKRLGLNIAKKLNALAGLAVTDDQQLPMNESSVLNLAKTNPPNPFYLSQSPPSALG